MTAWSIRAFRNVFTVGRNQKLPGTMPTQGWLMASCLRIDLNKGVYVPLVPFGTDAQICALRDGVLWQSPLCLNHSILRAIKTQGSRVCKVPPAVQK